MTLLEPALEFRQRPIEFRIIKDGKKKLGRILADVLPYGKVDDYRTAFRAGTFSASLRDHLPTMLWSHNMLDPIGSWIDADDNNQRMRLLGQLDLERDEETRAPIVPQAHRAWLQLEKRTISQFSVGFIRQESQPHREVRGVTEITRGILDEVSPVVSGSVPGTNLISTRRASGLYAPEDVQRGEVRRKIFVMEDNSMERRSIFNRETRANPVGYNQYKRLHGASSGVAVPGGGGKSGGSSSGRQEATYTFDGKTHPRTSPAGEQLYAPPKGTKVSGTHSAVKSGDWIADSTAPRSDAGSYVKSISSNGRGQVQIHLESGAMRSFGEHVPIRDGSVIRPSKSREVAPAKKAAGGRSVSENAKTNKVVKNTQVRPPKSGLVTYPKKG